MQGTLEKVKSPSNLEVDEVDNYFRGTKNGWELGVPLINHLGKTPPIGGCWYACIYIYIICIYMYIFFFVLFCRFILSLFFLVIIVIITRIKFIRTLCFTAS